MALRCGLLVVLALALLAAPAHALTLVADYRFNDSLESSVPGAPPLTLVGGGHAFATETVRGSPNRVLTFPAGSGLHLPTAGFSLGFWTVVVDFRFVDVDGYRRILNFRDPGGSRATDNGLYVWDGKLNLYGPGSNPGAGTPFAPGRHVEVMMTQYNLTGAYNDIWAEGTFELSRGDVPGVDLSDGVWFFRDDANDEHSAGAVSRIRLYDDAVFNPNQVAVAPDPPSDGDGDGVFDYEDNCVTAGNADQADTDADGQGNACDRDDDGDGVPDGADGCPTVSDVGQRDSDGDKQVDGCDADDDGDGAPDAGDSCPLVARAGANGCPGAQLARAGKVRTRRAPRRGIRVLTGLDVACPSSPLTCAVKGSVTIARASSGSAAVRRLGRVSVTMQPGSRKAVAIRLSKSGAAALRKAGRLPVRVKVAATGADTRPVGITRRATIKPPS